MIENHLLFWLYMMFRCFAPAIIAGYWLSLIRKYRRVKDEIQTNSS